MSGSTSNRRRSGTGWPLTQREAGTRELVAIKRALAFVEAAGSELLAREVRRAAGLVEGNTYADVIPLNPSRRRALADVFDLDDFYDLESLHESDYLTSLRVAGDAKERRRLRAATVTSKPTCLYRFHDDAGRLLYVGISSNPDEREKQHRYSQRWAPLIAEREDEWFDTREEALRAEAEAIRDESPLFNEAGRPRLPAMPRETA